MSDVTPVTRSVDGQTFGTGSVSLLDPVYIFKGKLRARATRDKPHDAFDLRFLEGSFHEELFQNHNEFSLEYAGLAMKRSPELEYVFSRIGLDLHVAKACVATVDLNQLPRPQPGDVQKGLLAPPETSR